MHPPNSPRRQMPRFALPLALALAAGPVPSGAAEPPGLPTTPRRPAVDHYHGEAVEDPYRWLEEMDAEPTREWIRAQDALTRSTLEPLPERRALLRRLESYRAGEHLSAPQFRGGRVFFEVARRTDDGSLYQELVVREDGARRVLVATPDLPPDSTLATFSGSGTPSFAASPDGRHVAFGVRPANSIWTRWQVVDVETGDRLPPVVDGISTRVATTVWWAPDGNGFFYLAFDRPGQSESSADLRSHSLYFHRLEGGDDALIYRHPDPERTFRATVTSDGRHVGLVNLTGDDQEVYLVDLASEEPTARRLLGGAGKTHSLLDTVDGRLWVLAHSAAAPAGRLISVDLADGSAATVIPEPEHGSLVDAAIFGGRLLLQRVDHAVPRLDIYDLEGRRLGPVELPYIGWIRSGLIGTRDDARAAFSIQGSADPGAVYRIDMETGKTELFHRPTDFDADRYATRRVFYPGRDGTLVPLFLMYRKGIHLDGANPVWLYAYGSRWSAAPWYQPQHRLWLELGGIYALAHVRGGGEYGNRWIEAGLGLNKLRGIDDFIDAARWLVDSGYASPRTIVANGGSASGPLAAAAVNRRPDLFRAAAISYGLSDMLRAHRFASPLLSSAFDRPETAEKFRALRSWSPYHNTRAGVCYPAAFIAHGDEDRTAVPLHSYKLTAAWQAAQGCERPIRLQVAWERGHTVGGLPERANQMAFLVRELGLTVPEDW